MQNALYGRRDVRGWRQPARGPMMFRENKALLHELQCSDVWGVMMKLQNVDFLGDGMNLFLGWCNFQLATVWKEQWRARDAGDSPMTSIADLWAFSWYLQAVE